MYRVYWSESVSQDYATQEDAEAAAIEELRKFPTGYKDGIEVVRVVSRLTVVAGPVTVKKESVDD